MGQASSTRGEIGKHSAENCSIKQKNKGLEEQLRGSVAGCEAGRHDTVQRQHEDAECLVLGDSIIQNVESEHVRNYN
jgi:hypothetical protein